MKKSVVLSIIDEVMNNREIDSIRNAILAIRDKVLEIDDENEGLHKHYVAKLKLRGHNELYCTVPFFPGAQYLCVDTFEKVDTGLYGTYWYE